MPHNPESPPLGDISQGINGWEGNCGRPSPGWGRLCRARWKGRAATWDPWHTRVSSAGLKSGFNKASEEPPIPEDPPWAPRVEGQQREPKVAAWAGVGNGVCTCPVKPSKISLLTWQRPQHWGQILGLKQSQNENPPPASISLFKKLQFKMKHKPGTLPRDCTAFK